MPLMPRFEAEVPNSGFDRDATPRWLMVGHRDLKSLFLVNGAGWVVNSLNTNIATIQEMSSNDANRREFFITGTSPGVTFIEGFLHHGGKIPFGRLLMISVKNAMRLTIAFQFVEDTTRSTQIVDQLLDELNAIYEDQTNITFRKTRAVKVSVAPSLESIVVEEERNAGRGARARTHPWTDKLVAEGDPDANLNVFFMPWQGTEDKRPSQMVVNAGDFLCADGMSDDKVKIALPHEVGRFLGCPVTFNDRQKNHLMFSSRAEGLDPLPGSRSFIPRDCAETMNPS